jgi:hypothetical protein
MSKIRGVNADGPLYDEAAGTAAWWAAAANRPAPAELDPEREQAIRGDALNAAVMVLGDVAGTTVGVANHVIDLAELFVGWIRDGARP